MVPVGEVQPELVSRRTRSSGGGGGGSTTGQPWGHIIQLFGVKEALENNGIGTRLQSAIEQWAREVSCLPVSTRTSIVASATTATSLLQAQAQRLVVLSVEPCHPRKENYWLEKVRRASAPGAIATYHAQRRAAASLRAGGLQRELRRLVARSAEQPERVGSVKPAARRRLAALPRARLVSEWPLPRWQLRWPSVTQISPRPPAVLSALLGAGQEEEKAEAAEVRRHAALQAAPGHPHAASRLP